VVILMSGVWRWRTAAIVGAFAWLSLAVTVASASVRRSDANASRAFLRAYSRYLDASLANRAHEEAVGAALVQQLDHECSGVLVGAPSNVATGTMSFIVAAVLDEATAPLRKSLARSIRTLRWSSLEVTISVEDAVLLLKREGPKLTPSEWCQPLRAWAERGFKGEQPDTYLGAPAFYEAAEVLTELERYEGARLRSYSRRTRHLERRARARLPVLMIALATEEALEHTRNPGAWARYSK